MRGEMTRRTPQPRLHLITGAKRELFMGMTDGPSPGAMAAVPTTEAAATRSHPTRADAPAAS